MEHIDELTKNTPDRILEKVRRYKRVPLKDLVEQFHTKKNAIQSYVDFLEENGLIKIERKMGHVYLIDADLTDKQIEQKIEEERNKPIFGEEKQKQDDRSIIDRQTRALMFPKDTFAEEKENATFLKGFTNVVTASIIMLLISAVIVVLLNTSYGADDFLMRSGFTGIVPFFQSLDNLNRTVMFFAAILAGPIVAWLIISFLSNLFAKTFGRGNAFIRTAYVTSLFLPPLVLLGLLLLAVSPIHLLVPYYGFYIKMIFIAVPFVLGIRLSILAIKEVQEFGVLEASLCWFLSYVVMLFSGYWIFRMVV